MRRFSLLTALVLAAACTDGGPVKHIPPGTTGAIGKWALQTYNGGALPYTGTKNANGSVNRVDSGTLTLDEKSKTYLLDIKIVNTLGTTVTPQDYAEVGSFATNSSGGYTFKPNDLSGGTNGQVFATVPVTVSGNSLSFPQQGKILTFTRQ
jgi:hypothetical protein